MIRARRRVYDPPPAPGLLVAPGQLGGQRGRRRGAAVLQELRAPGGLVVLADRGGRLAQYVQAAQETAVRLVLPRDRAVSLPARAAQLVQAAVVAGPGVGVRGDHV